MSTCGDNVLWHYSSECWRVLRENGVWLCISYANEASRMPSFRVPVLPRAHIGLVFNDHLGWQGECEERCVVDLLEEPMECAATMAAKESVVTCAKVLARRVDGCRWHVDDADVLWAKTVVAFLGWGRFGGGEFCVVEEGRTTVLGMGSE